MRLGFWSGILAGGLVIGTVVSVNRQADGPATQIGVGESVDAFAGLIGEGAQAVPKIRQAIQPAVDEVASVASDQDGSGAATNEGPDPDAGAGSP